MSRKILPGLEYPAVTEDGRIEGVQHPTSLLDVANKEYVDIAVANMRWDFYFNAAASGIGAYYKMANLPTGLTESTFTSDPLGAGDDQLIFSWITDAVVLFDSIEAGVIDIHLHTQRTVGNRYTVLYAKVYEYTSTPTEVLIGTTELSVPITDTKSPVSFHLSLGSDYEIAATSKLLVKIFANLGNGSNTTIALYAEGTNASRIALPVPSEALNDIYIRHSLATAVSDFLAASGAGVYVKKTLAETLAILVHAHLLAAGATDVTATAAELNLLDLAGLTAGELLVATGAAAAAWKSSGVVLTAPVLDGTVTNAGAALVLPAHSLGGTLAMGANSITLDANETVDGVDVSAHNANTTTAHGAVSAATASKHVVRDASARAKFAAPGASGDALIKGTRHLIAELPALTTGKIWKGVGGVPAEADEAGFTSRARAYLNNGGAVQTLQDATFCGVFLDTEEFDGDGEFDSTVKTGTADATETNYLRDADGGFEEADVGAWVWNTTDNTYAQVSTFVNSGKLGLSYIDVGPIDIMASGEGYKLYRAKFTAAAAGYYLITALGAVSMIDATRPRYGILKNGVFAHVTVYHASFTAYLYGNIATIIYLDDSDSVQSAVRQDTGTTQSLFYGNDQSFMAIHKLSKPS